MKEQFKTVKLSEVQESKTNPRKSYDNAALKELAESIKQHGIIQPLIVRAAKKGFELVSGSRRLRAAKEAKLKEVPVIVKDLSDEDVIEIQIIENLQRQDIHPMEEAEGFTNLVKSQKYDPKTISEKIGKSITYVYQRLSLMNLNAFIADLFRSNDLTFPQVKPLLRLPAERQTECFKDFFLDWEYKHKKSIPEKYPEGYFSHVKPSGVEDWISSHNDKNLNKAPFNINDKLLIPKSGSCADCVHNTANLSELFPDYSKNKSCMNPKCFLEKVQANLRNKREDLKKKYGDDGFVLISDSYQPDNKDALGYTKYNECKKSDKGARVALLVEASGREAYENLGRVKYVKLNSDMRKDNSEENKKEREKEKQRKRESLAEDNARIVAIESIASFIGSLYSHDNAPVSTSVLLILIKMAIENLSHDEKSKLKNFYHWDVPQSKYNANCSDYDEFFSKYLKEIEKDYVNLWLFYWKLHLWKFIQESFLLENPDDGNVDDPIDLLTKEFKIDIEKIRKEQIELLSVKSKPAKEKKKSAKK